jgi:uncharacterized protein YutE (UPF0331/DUF86 family)
MSPIEVEIIKRKIAVIIENLRAINPLKDMSEEDYFKDLYKRKASERLLQELIEAAIDTSTHLIVWKGHPPPDDYYESFIKAGELGIISFDLSTRLAPSAGLGNRLVHEYDMLEHALVFKAISVTEDLYSRYVKEINDYISKAA